MYVEACYEHDIHYRTHATVYGKSIKRRQADAVLRERIQSRSRFGCCSPMAWWRWFFLRICGERAWEDNERGTPIADWWGGNENNIQS